MKIPVNRRVVPRPELVLQCPELADAEGEIIADEGVTVVVRWASRDRDYRIPRALLAHRNDHVRRTI